MSENGIMTKLTMMTKLTNVFSVILKNFRL